MDKKPGKTGILPRPEDVGLETNEPRERHDQSFEYNEESNPEVGEGRDPDKDRDDSATGDPDNLGGLRRRNR